LRGGIGLNGPAFERQRLGAEQRSGHLAPRRLPRPREGRTRDAHAPRRLLLIQPLEVSQAQGLEFIEAEGDPLQFARGDARRLEEPDFGVAEDSADGSRVWDVRALLCAPFVLSICS
jgi:hypothetical protein